MGGSLAGAGPAELRALQVCSSPAGGAGFPRAMWASGMDVNCSPGFLSGLPGWPQRHQVLSAHGASLQLDSGVGTVDKDPQLPPGVTQSGPAPSSLYISWNTGNPSGHGSLCFKLPGMSTLLWVLTLGLGAGWPGTWRVLSLCPLLQGPGGFSSQSLAWVNAITNVNFFLLIFDQGHFLKFFFIYLFDK